jgi:hypothetical protein
MNNTYKISAKILDTTDSNISVEDLLEKVEGEFGFIPNMYKHMGSHSPMLETYLSGVSRFRKDSLFNIIEQEVIFLTLSILNKCEYCTSSHSLISVAKANMPLHILREVCEHGAVSDYKVNTLQKFVTHLYERKGAADILEANNFLDAGYT